MTKVWCNNFDCKKRDDSGVCQADEIHKDGRYCSGFTKEGEYMYFTYGEKGFEGYVISKRPRVVFSSEGKKEEGYVIGSRAFCPKCKGEAKHIELNYYACTAKGCEVQTFRVATSGTPYEITSKPVEVELITTREELDARLDKKGRGR